LAGGHDTKGTGPVSDAKVIDEMLTEIGGWRGAALSKLRTLILQADPDAVEELKWKKPTNRS